MAIKLPDSYFLGTNLPNPKVYFKTIKAIINALNNGITRTRTAAPINSTATATATQVATGYITSTSASATSITLPSATLLASALGVTGGGAIFDLIVDNSAGANTVTVVASGTITAASAVLTGGATLTVASGATGLFRIYFSSTTVAKIYRMG